MAKNKKQNMPASDHEGVNLKGTFIAVMLLGVFILVLWFGMYALFLSR